MADDIKDLIRQLDNGDFEKDIPPSYDYASDLNEGNVLSVMKSADFINDLKEFYRQRDGLNLSTDQEALDKYYSDRRWRNINPEASGIDAYQAHSMSPEQAARLGRIQKVYETSPNFYQEGGEGALGLIKNIGVGAFSLTSLIPVGRAGVAAEMALKGAAQGTSRAKLISTAAKAGFLSGAKTDAITNAGVGVATDYALQARNKEIGLQSEYSATQGIASALTGGIIGGGIGGAVGAGTGVLKGMAVEELSRKTGRAISDVVNAMQSGNFKTAAELEQHLTSPITNPADPANPAGASTAQNSQGMTPATQAAATAAASPSHPFPFSQPEIDRAKAILAKETENYQSHLQAMQDEISATQGRSKLADLLEGKINAKDIEGGEAYLALQKELEASKRLLRWEAERADLSAQRDNLTSGIEPGKAAGKIVGERIDSITQKIERGDALYSSVVRKANAENPSLGVMKALSETSSEPPQPAAPVAEPGQALAAQVPAEVSPLKFLKGIPEDATPEDIIAEAISAQNTPDAPANYLDTLRAAYAAKTSGAALSVEKPPAAPTPAPAATPAAAPSVILPENQLNEENINAAIQSADREDARLTKAIERAQKKAAAGTSKPEDAAALAKNITEREAIRVAKGELEKHLAKVSASPIVERVNQNSANEELPFLFDKVSDAQSAEQNFTHMVEALTVDGDPELLYNTGIVRSLINELPVSTSTKTDLTGLYLDLIEKVSDDVYFSAMADGDFTHEEVMPMLREKYGDYVADMIDRKRNSAPDLQKMKVDGAKTPSSPSDFKPEGWDLLSAEQQRAVETRVQNYGTTARGRLGAMLLPESKIREEMIRFKTAVVEKLALEKIGTIKPPPDLVQAGSMQPLNTTYGVAPAKGGLRKIDAEGNVYTEHPYYGQLFIRDVKLDKDGNPIIKTSRGGKAYKERYSAGESALNAFDEAVIAHLERNSKGKVRTGLVKDPSKYLEVTEVDPATGKRRVVSITGKHADIVKKLNDIMQGIKNSPEIKKMRGELALLEAKVADLEANKAPLSERSMAVADFNNKQAQIETTLADKLQPFLIRKELLTLSTKAEAEANRIERRNANKALKARVIGKRGEPTQEQAQAEALHKLLRERATRDAVRAAEEMPPEAYSEAARANIDQANDLHQNITAEEINAGQQDAIKLNRSEASKAEMKAQLQAIQEELSITGDVEAAKARMIEVLQGKKATIKSPAAHADKPAGVKFEPKIVVMNGIEVDVRNQFEYQKTAPGQFDVVFLQKKVGQTIANKDGSMTVLNLTSEASTHIFKGAADASLELPRIFWKEIRSAAQDGKLAGKLTDGQNSKVYTVDWKSSKTYSKADTVPKETEVAQQLALPPVAVPNVNGERALTRQNLKAAGSLPDGNVMAIQFITGKYAGVTRVENTRGAPQTVGSMLGKSTDQYVVGYVPEGTRSGHPEANASFKPVNPDDEALLNRKYSDLKYPAGKKREEASAFDRNTGQLIFAKLDQVKIDPADLPEAIKDMGINTVSDVHDMIVAANNTNWQAIATGLDYAKFISKMQDMYSVLKKYAPEGIRYPNTDRVQAMKQWQALFTNNKKFSELEISTGMDLLRRLSSHDRDLPIISKGTRGEGLAYSVPVKTDPESNRVYLDTDELIGKNGDPLIPAPVALLHELGHWAYFNILSPDDHLEFWSGMAKHYGISDQNLAAIKANRFEDISGDLMNSKVKLSDIAKRLPGIDPKSEISSPAEFFANQFTQWVVSQKKINNYSLWQRMSKGLVGMFDKAKAIASKFGLKLYHEGGVAGSDTNFDLIDDDLVKLFEKIMPDGETQFNRYKELRQKFPPIKGSAGATSLAVKKLDDFDQARLRMSDAIDVADPIELAEALRDVGKEIVGSINSVKLFKGPRQLKLRGDLWKAQREAFLYLYQHNKSLGNIMGDTMLNEREMEALRSATIGQNGDGLTISAQALEQAAKFSDDEHVMNLQRLVINIDNALANAQQFLRNVVKYNLQRADDSVIANILPSGELIKRPALANRGATVAKRIAKAQAKREKDAIEEAFRITEADLNIDTREAPAPSLADNIPSKSAKDLTTRQLAERIKNMPGKSREKNDMIAEFMARGNAELKKGKINPADLEKRPVDLQNQARNAIARADYERAEEIARAYAFVARTKEPVVRVEDGKARRVIEATHVDTKGVSDQGIPHNAPTHLADMLTKLTHRDKLFDRYTKEMAYRLFAMMDKADILSSPSPITAEDLTKLTGKAVENRDDLSNSEALKFLRDSLRQLATNMKNPSQHIDTAERMAEFVFRASASPADMRVLDSLIRTLSAEDQAFAKAHPEKWVAEQYAAMIDPKVGLDKSKALRHLEESELQELRSLLNPLHERVATVFNGTPVQRNLQSMRIFGDQFIKKDHPIIEAARDIGVENGIPLNVASKFVSEYIAALPQNIKQTIAAKFATSPSRLADRVAFSVPYAGQRGIGFARKLVMDITPDHTANIDGVIEAVTRQAMEKASPRKRAVISEHNSILSDLHKSLAKSGNDAEYTSSIMGAIKAHWRALEKLDPTIRVTVDVKPHFYKALKSFSMTSDDIYTISDAVPNSVNYILEHMVSTKQISANDAKNMATELGETFSGSDLLRVMSSSKFGSSPGKVRSALEKLRFDSLITDASDADGMGPASRYIHLFNDNNLEPVDFKDYTRDTIDALGHQDITDAPGLGGKMLEEVINSEANIDVTQTEGTTAVLQKMNVTGLRSFVRKVARQEPLTETDVAAAYDDGVIQLSSNSDRLNRASAHTLAEAIDPRQNNNGVYEAQEMEFAKIILPIQKALASLPDAPTPVRGFFNKINPFTPEPTPPSHATIARALRSGDAAVEALPKPLRDVAKAIRSAFKKELELNRASGTKVGEIENYLPQVMNVEFIKRNKDQYIKEWSAYFKREMLQRDRAMLGADPERSAAEKAERLFTIVTHDGSGVLHGDEMVNYGRENHIFSRILHMEQEDLDLGLDKWFVNNLDDLTVKYFDKMVQRRVMNEKFGVGNHGSHAYINIAAGGKDAAVRALMNDIKEGTITRYGDPTMETKVILETDVVPAMRYSEEDISEFMDTVVSTLGKTKETRQANKAKAEMLLMEVVDPSLRSNPEFQKRVHWIVSGLADFGPDGSAVSRDEFNFMNNVVAVVNKKPIDGQYPSERMMKYSRYLRTFNSVTLLSYTVLASIPDTVMPLVRSGQFGAWWKGWSKYMSDPEIRQATKNIGAGVGNLVYERLAHMNNDDFGRINQSFFRATGLHHWTEMQRNVASLVGFEAFKADVNLVRKAMARGDTSTREFRIALNFLKEYGLEHLTAPGAQSMESITEATSSDAIRRAMIKFANDTIFTPNPNDIPIWAQRPLGMLAFQLKSYPLMMARLSGYVINQAFKQGNPKPLIYLLTVGAAAGGLSISTRDLVQSRGGEDNDAVALRNRDASNTETSIYAMLKKLGIEPEEGSSRDAMLGWYIEAILATGGLGMLGELLHNTADQLDNGAFGRERIWSMIAGPSFSTANQALTIAAGAQQALLDSEDKNDKKREAIRAIASRIPLAGGNAAFRNMASDVIAGESQK